jgi:hypothetical protein
MALVGLFPLAGFWSKDEILADAWADRQWVFWIALTGVFLTALYVGRMLILTFAGEYRGGEPSAHGAAPADEHHGPKTPHESPALILIPLVILAVLAAIAGFANINDDFTTLIDGWLPRETEELATHGDFKMWIALASTGAGLGGLLTAWLVYQVQVLKSEKIAAFLQPLPEILENKYYLDALYENAIKGPPSRRRRLCGVALGPLCGGRCRQRRWQTDTLDRGARAPGPGRTGPTLRDGSGPGCRRRHRRTAGGEPVMLSFIIFFPIAGAVLITAAGTGEQWRSGWPRWLRQSLACVAALFVPQP